MQRLVSQLACFREHRSAVEDGGGTVLIAHAVRLEQAVPYGEMWTTQSGHYEVWSALARRGGHALRAAGIPAAPLWSEYDEWPRGRVVYDGEARRFVVRADRQLLRPPFGRLIGSRFGIDPATTAMLPDDHYRSLRRVKPPTTRRVGGTG